MSRNRRRWLIAGVWAVAVAVGVALALVSSFARIWQEELFPIGCAAGWIARDAAGRRRRYR